MSTKRIGIVLVITAATALLLACASTAPPPGHVAPQPVAAAASPSGAMQGGATGEASPAANNAPAAQPESVPAVPTPEEMAANKLVTMNHDGDHHEGQVTSAPSAVKALSHPLTTVVADTVPRNFSLTAASKDPTHPYFGYGSNLGFVLDGVQGKELVLTRGITYVFQVNTGVMHDFYFTTSPVGRGAGTVTEGITGQFTYKGDVTFTPGSNTPDVMYYECRNHRYMGGKIHIANAGDKVTIGGKPEIDVAEEVKPVATVEQVNQKLAYAKMLMDSTAAQRVVASGNVQAKNLITQAGQQMVATQHALSANNVETAMNEVDEALRFINNAVRLVPDPTLQAEQDKAHYADLLEHIHSFDASYEKNLARGYKPKEGTALDQAEYKHLLIEAAGLAAQGEYGQADALLVSADNMVTAALAALLQSQVVVYEKNFTNPKDEYDYELGRYKSYEDLIPVAIEQRSPLPETLNMMNDLVKRAKEIQGEALGLADKGDYKMAIMALQAATDHLQKALRLAGVQ